MAEKKTKDAAFSKKQLVAAERYAEKQDLINALLSDHELYTVSQTDALIDRYLKGKVN